MRYIAAFMLMITFLAGCNNNPAATINANKAGVVAIVSSSENTPGGLGTGYFIDDNLIVTNFHVAGETGAKLKVAMEDGTEMYDAEFIMGDKNADVAVIKIKDWDKFKLAYPHYKVLKWARHQPTIGEEVWAVGHPWGLFYSVSRGVVSSEMRKNPEDIPTWWIQTDAHVFQGNSGGPLFNDAGEIVGMNSLMMAKEGGSYGFALPAPLIRKVINDLEKYKEVRWGQLGIMMGGPGITVKEFPAQSAARDAGLKAGDQITAVKIGDGSTISLDSGSDLIVLLSTADYAEPVTLTVKRGDETMKIDVKLGFRASNDFKVQSQK